MRAEFMSRAGRRLRDVRARAGITRVEMAKCLGWSESYLRGVEDGKQAIGLYTIDCYAKALCLDTSMLFD